MKVSLYRETSSHIVAVKNLYLAFRPGFPKYQGLVFPRIGIDQKIAQISFSLNTYILTLYLERELELLCHICKLG